MQQFKKKSSKTVMRALALVLAFAMIATSIAISPVAADAAKKKKTKVKVSKVTITKPATSVLVLKKGKTYTLKKKVTVKPNKKANKKVTFKSSNKKVATVTSKGKIKAKKAGKAVITVTSKKNSKKKDKITVRVGTPITKITVKTTKKTIMVGKTFTLKVKKITPKKPTYKKVYFTSKNKKIASVNKKSGKVKGVKAGTTYIYAKAADGSGKSAKCKVTVKANDDPYAGMLKLEDFQSYEVGTAWTKSTRKNAKSEMKVIVDPENAENKMLEVKPAGYDTTPVIDINLPEGKTLGDYTGVLVSFRVKDSADAANKRAVAFFDEQGQITDTETNFMTYEPYTRAGLKEKTPEMSEADIAKNIRNNRFTKDVLHCTSEDDGQYNYFMPQYSETRAKNGEAQEAGWQTGWKNMKLVFDKAVMEKATKTETETINLLGLNKLSMAIGATYNETETLIGTEEQTVWYLDNVYLVPKPAQAVKVTSLAIAGAPEKLAVNGTVKLEAKAQPSDATDKSVTWSVEPANMATISETGELKAGATEGKVTVTATAKDGSNVKATATINIYTPVAATEDLVVDLSKLAAQTETAPKIQYDGTAVMEGDVCKVTFKGDYTTVLFDLGKAYDLSSYKMVTIDGKAIEQCGLELYPENLDMTNEKYFEDYAKGGQNAFKYYPFYKGTHAFKPGYGPGEANGRKDGTGLGDFGNQDTTAPLSFLKDGDLLEGALSNIRYVSFKNNQIDATEAAPVDVYVKEIRFVARKADEVDKFTELTAPATVNENFNTEATAFNVVKNSNANAQLGTWASESNGNGYVTVAGDTVNGTQLFINNTNGTADKAFYIAAKVRANDETGMYKSIAMTLKKDYSGSQFHGTVTDAEVANLKGRKLNNVWESVKSKITVPAGKFIQVVLQSNFAYDIDDVVVEEYTNQDLTVEPDAVKPVSVTAKDFKIDFDENAATVNKSQSDATIEVVEDPTQSGNHALSYTYAADQYGKVYAYFNIKLEEGTTLADYKEVKLRYYGGAGDIGYKSVFMVAADKETGLPAEFAYDWDSSAFTNATSVATPQSVNGTGWFDITLPLTDGAEGITGTDIQVCFYMNVGAAASEVPTNYMFDDIEFVAKSTIPQNIDVDMSTATIMEGVSGGMVTDPADENNEALQLTYDTAQYGGAYAKFDLDLGDFTLADYKSVKVRYRGVAGDVGYKKLYLVAADKETGLPAEIAYDWDSSSFTNATSYATPVSINGTDTWNECELVIDPDLAATMTAKNLEFSIFINAGNNSSDVKTSYMFDDIQFVANAPAQLEDVDIDLATKTATAGINATVVDDPEDADKDALDILYTTGQYGGAYAKFDLPLNGFNLSDYKSVTLRYRGVAGDVGYKKLYLIAADKETGIPAEIAYDWDSSSFTNATSVATPVSVNGSGTWNEIELVIDQDAAALFDGKDMEFSVFMNAGATSSDVATEYMFSDIKFVADKPAELANIDVDLETATIMEGVTGGVVTDPADENNEALQLTYDTAQYGGAYAKFDLDLGDFALENFKSVKVRYRGVAGDVGYKKLYLVAADKETGLPAEIAYDWDSSSFTNATSYATPVSINGTDTWNECELVIDPDLAATMTAKNLEFSIFINAGNNSSDVKTSYMFDDIQFVANVAAGPVVE